MSQSLFLDRPGWCAGWQIVQIEISISADKVEEYVAGEFYIAIRLHRVTRIHAQLELHPLTETYRRCEVQGMVLAVGSQRKM